MGSKREVGLDPRGPLDYMGPDIALLTVSQNDRAPTTADKNYPQAHHWRIDSSAIAPALEGDMWFLAKFEVNGDADWQKIASGATPGGTVITISDGTTAVNPDITGDIALTAAVGSGLTITSVPGSNELAFDLIGLGNAVTELGVDHATAPGTNPVLPMSGRINITAAAVPASDIPIRTESLAANAFQVQLQEASVIKSTDASKSGLSHYDINDFNVDANGFTQLKNGALVENLGLVYDSATGVFQVCGNGGSALSDANAAYVCIDDVTTVGTVSTSYPRRYKVIANQTFVDDTGASDIAGNSFQTAAVTWAYAMPFYVYAVQNTAKTAINFSLCRMPCLKKAPAVGKCAKKASAVADVQYGMFFLGDPVVADFASQSCVCLGSITMTKTTAAHDWTVSAQAFYDGIGQFKDSCWWQMPKVNNGCGNTIAGADSTFLDNTGTAAEIANPLLYKINLNNTMDIIMSSIVTKTGVGAVTALATMPLEILGAGGGIVSNGTLIYKAIAGNLQTAYVPQLAANYMGFAYCEGSTTLLQNDTLNVNDLLEASFNFKLYTNLLNGGVF